MLDLFLANLESSDFWNPSPIMTTQVVIYLSETFVYKIMRMGAKQYLQYFMLGYQRYMKTILRALSCGRRYQVITEERRLSFQLA
ncbi:hypothetical protein EAW52_22770 [Pseudomonas sp. LTJR-52]|nr:hypothetical protein EAW52_22770 [Pseudomonas sp. LTJR-52]